MLQNRIHCICFSTKSTTISITKFSFKIHFKGNALLNFNSEIINRGYEIIEEVFEWMKKPETKKRGSESELESG